MTEEEKKDIEKIGKELRLRTQAQLEIVEKDAGIDEVKLITEELGNMAFLIHIIDKLQKENEECYKALKNYGIEIDLEYIPKNKIREKIRYLGDEGYFEFNTKRDLEKAIEMFKGLLEEE